MEGRHHWTDYIVSEIPELRLGERWAWEAVRAPCCPTQHLLIT